VPFTPFVLFVLSGWSLGNWVGDDNDSEPLEIGGSKNEPRAFLSCSFGTIVGVSVIVGRVVSSSSLEGDVATNGRRGGKGTTPNGVPLAERSGVSLPSSHTRAGVACGHAGSPAGDLSKARHEPHKGFSLCMRSEVGCPSCFCPLRCP
jgi:hypothetical protein